MSDATRRIRAWGAAVPRLPAFALEHLLLLPLGAAIALIWANVAPESYFRLTYAIRFPVNDVAMTFFFALMTKEVVEATAPGGVLHSWRRALLPAIAAVGASLVPALIYVRAVDALGEPVLAIAWPVLLATDLAFAYFIARLVFGLHAAIPFILLLGIASDALGVVTLGLVQPERDLRLAVGALIAGVGVAIALGLRRARIRNFWPYLLAGGSLSWLGFFWSGLHPALALVPIVPFLPHGARDPGFFVDALPSERSALSQFEVWWRYPAQAALFFFGLVNAGVPLRALEAGTWGVPIALVLGKPLGILGATAVALAAGLHLPQGVGWRDLTVLGFIAAIAFTVGLFFTAALLAPGQLLAETGMGVLLSLAAAPLALLAARMLHVGRFARS